MAEITLENYTIVRDLHKEGLDDAIIAHRFGLATTHVRNIRNTPFQLLE